MKLEEAYNLILVNESANKSLTRFFNHFQNYDMAILTAFRKVDSEGTPLTWQANIQRNKKLKKQIRDAGYGFIQVKGYYSEVDPTTKENTPVYEQSIVVVDVNRGGIGNLKSNAIKWGEEWSQDSILFKPANGDAVIIGTNDTSDIQRGVEILIGKEKFNTPAEIFTKLKGDRQFSFSKDVDMSKYESFMIQSAKESAMKKLYKRRQ